MECPPVSLDINTRENFCLFNDKWKRFIREWKTILKQRRSVGSIKNCLK